MRMRKHTSPSPQTDPGSPFPAGEWSLFVPVDYYAMTVQWFTTHYLTTHPEFSLLVHTNTGGSKELRMESSQTWISRLHHIYQSVLLLFWILNCLYRFTVPLYSNLLAGCEYEDHSLWALWAGQAYPLDLSIFTKQTQTSEFNNTRGDAQNPVCAAAGATCGTAAMGGQQIICCSGSCSCANYPCTCSA